MKAVESYKESVKHRFANVIYTCRVSQMNRVEVTRQESPVVQIYRAAVVGEIKTAYSGPQANSEKRTGVEWDASEAIELCMDVVSTESTRKCFVK